MKFSFISGRDVAYMFFVGPRIKTILGHALYNDGANLSDKQFHDICFAATSRWSSAAQASLAFSSVAAAILAKPERISGRLLDQTIHWVGRADPAFAGAAEEFFKRVGQLLTPEQKQSVIRQLAAARPKKGRLQEIHSRLQKQLAS